MSLIKGENVVLYQYDGGQWKAWVCGRSCSLTTAAEDIETSISGSGAWRTFDYSGLTWSGSFEGLVYLQMTNKLSLPDLRGTQTARTKVLVRFQRTDTAANYYLDEGYAILKTITDTGEVNGMNTYSVELKGSGSLTQIFTPTPINPFNKVKRFEYTGVADETFFTSGLLNLVQVLEVNIDGTDCSKIILSGTPVNKEAKYTSSGGNGRIDVAIPIANGTECYVMYQDL